MVRSCITACRRIVGVFCLSAMMATVVAVASCVERDGHLPPVGDTVIAPHRADAGAGMQSVVDTVVGPAQSAGGARTSPYNADRIRTYRYATYGFSMAMGPSPTAPIDTGRHDAMGTVEVASGPADAGIIAHLAEGMFSASLYAGITSVGRRLTMHGMPRNTRHIPEGYWIGACPEPENIDELHARGIRLVITAANIPPRRLRELVERMDVLGMTHVNIPFGGKFPRLGAVLPTIFSFEPNQTYIHCEHGGDRSGAVLAYLLIVRHGWTIPSALLAVAVPTMSNAGALSDILKGRRLRISKIDVDRYLGIYSGTSNGGFGGLKIYGDGGYIKLVNTTIDAALRYLKEAGAEDPTRRHSKRH